MKCDIDLLKEMKKIRNGSGVTRSELPDNVANANGEEEIVDKFREVYSALYSSSGSQPEMQELRQKVTQLISVNAVGEVAKVTGQTVKEAALSMKPGKKVMYQGRSHLMLYCMPQTSYLSIWQLCSGASCSMGL
jgi:hypothetical protein